MEDRKTYSLFERKSKVSINDFCTPFFDKKFFFHFISSLPNILAAKELRILLKRCIEAKRGGGKIVFGLGAHIIKCGLSPLFIEAINKGVVDAFCMNGAVLVHDTEIALCGKTSEDVEEGIRDGSFGMAKETADFINACIKEAASTHNTIPYTIGKRIEEEKLPFREKSLLFYIYKKEVKATAHIGIGTDIVHIHPLCPKSWGEASFNDFEVFTQIVKELEGGVFINFGSAVIIPEVFLKALSLARSEGKACRITCANFDFLLHYRPRENIVRRPTQGEGSFGCYIIGHHEIMAPLFIGALIAFLEEEDG